MKYLPWAYYIKLYTVPAELQYMLQQRKTIHTFLKRKTGRNKNKLTHGFLIKIFISFLQYMNSVSLCVSTSNIVLHRTPHLQTSHSHHSILPCLKLTYSSRLQGNSWFMEILITYQQLMCQEGSIQYETFGFVFEQA